MKTHLLHTSIESVEADAVAVVLFKASEDTPPGGDYDSLTGGLIRELYESKEFTGKALDTTLIHRPGRIQGLAFAAGRRRQASRVHTTETAPSRGNRVEIPQA